jgi:DNA-binding NarL/FixJ family response regulator
MRVSGTAGNNPLDRNNHPGTREELGGNWNRRVFIFAFRIRPTLISGFPVTTLPGTLEDARFSPFLPGHPTTSSFLVQSMGTIDVLIADSHTIFREGLRSLLRHEKDLRVVGEASTCLEAIGLARRLQPAIIVIDSALPDHSGFEGAIRIMRENPAIKIVILSTYDDQTLVAQAAKAGIQGYLIKQTASGEFLAALRAVAAGKSWFSTSVHTFILAMNEERQPLLTPRETQVLQMIARGIPNKDISRELAISIKTVEKHRQQIMDKLNIHDVAGITRYAVRKGLV